MKPATRVHILYDSIHIKFQKREISRQKVDLWLLRAGRDADGGTGAGVITKEYRVSF